MHILNQSNKRKIREELVAGARKYEKYLTGKIFLIITNDGEKNEVCFHQSDFAHLAGVRTNLNDRDFYKSCIKGTLSENNILSNHIMILEH